MIHELIDPKKKTNKTTIKTLQENKAIIEDCNFEPSDSENKEAESSSTTFIPPWLRNSLGLNQRNNLSHPTPTSDTKPPKIIQKSKEPCQNEFNSLKTNTEQDSCKKAVDHFEVLPQCSPQEDNIPKSTDNVEDPYVKCDRDVSMYWDVRPKDSETESSCTNEETKSIMKEDSKIIDTDAITLADFGKIKEEEKKKLKLVKHKNKLRKRNLGDQKQQDLEKNSMDFLLEMKARETLDSFLKKEVQNARSEMKNLNDKISNSKNFNSKLNQQELRLLQEIKNQVGSVENVEKLFEHIKEFNVREIIKNPIFKSKTVTEKKREDKEEKSGREVVQNVNEDGSPRREKDSLLSTDDENDIKKFSEFLSKNRNLDEKRKCLEEVRNYFEKKRRLRMSKRRFLEEEKPKIIPEPEEKEHSKDKMKFKDFYRGRRSKFSLCDEEVVERAVDETLQKFVEMYHIHVSPTVMGNMKKNILQAMAFEILDSENSKTTDTTSVKKTNLDLLNSTNKEPEKEESRFSPESEVIEVPNQEPTTHKEIKKKIFKTLIESSGEQISKSAKETDVVENEKLKCLKKEFDNFLQSVKSHVDVTSIRLQSILLQKEELAVPSKNVQFVYNFTKKSLESEKQDVSQNLKDSSAAKNCNDSETQTIWENEVIKRNVKVQTCEQKNKCEENLQTDDTVCSAQSTQTNDQGITIQEIKELINSDISPGLYRMVKSKEAGKFYLYPEQEDSKQDVSKKSSSSVMKDKKINKKKEAQNVLSKERTKERRVYFKEREKSRLKKKTKALALLPKLKGSLSKQEKDKVGTGNSINCLYFRDLDKKNSESVSSKKEIDLTDENDWEKLEVGRGDVNEEMKEPEPKTPSMGCFWFWNGEKITPGCDLKTHVEDLLKEKLKEMTNIKPHQNDFVVNPPSLSTEKQQQNQLFQKSLANMFCPSVVQNNAIEIASRLTENECLNEKNKIEMIKPESEENEQMLMPVSKKPVRNASTQNSQHTLMSLNLSKLKIQSKINNSVKKKYNKRNMVIRPAKGKTVNWKKAEDIIKAVGEYRKIKLGFENQKKENALDSESTPDGSIYTSGSKVEFKDPLSMVLGLKDNFEADEMSNYDFKNKLKKKNSLICREIQTGDKCSLEDVNFNENSSLGKYKHLELIESILGRASHREREDLWNNIKDFIKKKIGKDINDEGAREVCIEIEQEMPKYNQGKFKHAVMAKGHYAKNEGDVEVEIDLTLDDLEKILRQRQKKNRRKTLYRSSRSKNFLSSSSVQSDFTKDDLRRYQKYLQKFVVRRGGNFAQNKEVKAYLEK